MPIRPRTASATLNGDARSTPALPVGPPPSAEASTAVAEAMKVAARLRRRPTSALASYRGCSVAENARPSDAAQEINTRMTTALDQITRVLASTEESHGAGRGGKGTFHLTGGGGDADAPAGPAERRRNHHQHAMADGRQVAVGPCSAIAAEPRSATRARLTAIPRHVADRIPRIAPRMRVASRNATDVAATNKSSNTTTAANGQQSSSSTHGLDAEAREEARAALLDTFDQEQFPTAMSKCAFLRDRPDMRRAFAARVDRSVTVERRQRLSVRRRRVEEVKAADKELTESYLASSLQQMKGGSGPTHGGSFGASTSFALDIQPPAAMAASPTSNRRGRSPTTPESFRGIGNNDDGQFEFMSDAGSVTSAARRMNDQYYQSALKASHALRRRQRQADAKVRREGLQSWRTARAIDELQRPEFNRVRRLKEAEQEILSNTWATFVVFASSLFEIHDRFVSALARARAPAAVMKRYTAPGVAMQSAAELRERIRLNRAIRTIEKFWGRLRARFFERKRVKAAGVVRSFMKALGESIRIPLAVRKKMRVVRLLQRLHRNRPVLRAARRESGVRQVRAALVKAIETDEIEIASLHSTLKQHERELSLKKGLHRIARQESMNKVRNMVNDRISFIDRRREASRSFTDAEILEHVDHAFNQRESVYGDTVYRFGHAWKYHLVLTATDSEFGTSSFKGIAGALNEDGSAVDTAHLLQQMEAAQRMGASQSLAASLTKSITATAAAAAASTRPSSGSPTRRASPSGVTHLRQSYVALPVPKNPTLKPNKPSFRNLLTADEVAAVIMAAVDARERRQRAAEAANESVA